MAKEFDLLGQIFDQDNSLLNFLSEMTDLDRQKVIEECKEQIFEDPAEEAFSEGLCTGITAGFNVGFVYGNMFEVVDPEAKKYVEALRKKLIHDGALMFTPRERKARAD